jgi:hypothetical protein
VVLLPPSLDRTSVVASSPDRTTIVLDDEPLLYDDGSLVVEEARAVAAVDEPGAWDSKDDARDDISVIEVGDEVVFDA